MKNKKWPVVIYSIYVMKTPPVRATGGFEKFVDYGVTLATMWQQNNGNRGGTFAHREIKCRTVRLSGIYDLLSLPMQLKYVTPLHIKFIVTILLISNRIHCIVYIWIKLDLSQIIPIIFQTSPLHKKNTNVALKVKYIKFSNFKLYWQHAWQENTLKITGKMPY